MTGGVPPWVPVADRPAPVRRRPAEAGHRRVDGCSAYAAAALARETDAIASAGKGHRNFTLNQRAFSIGQLVAGGEIDHATAWDALVDAALSAGLSEREAHKTITSAFRGAESSPRTAPPRPALDDARLAAFVADGPADRVGGRLVWAVRQVAGRADPEQAIHTLVRAATAAGMPLDDAVQAVRRARRAGQGQR
jgi:hypothetical protein